MYVKYSFNKKSPHSTDGIRQKDDESSTEHVQRRVINMSFLMPHLLTSVFHFSRN